MQDDTVPSATLPSTGSGADDSNGTGTSAGTGTDDSTSAVAPNRPDGEARPYGWGADLPDENRPAVPMERKPARLEGVHWDHPEQQEQKVTVLCSVERPGITPLFGSTLPPRGLSGMVRGAAFRYSENDLRHWLLLLAADRINMGEGLVDDLLSGRVPNVPREMGLRAEWQHNPRGAVHKLGLAVGVLAALYLLRQRRKR